MQTVLVDVIYAHTEGEPTCIVPGGIVYPHGTDIAAKRRFLEANYDWLRKALICEPRGHRDMIGVFVTPPSSPHATLGAIWMDGDGFRHFCGHGTIALGMAMISSNMIASEDNPANLKFEMTAGTINVEVGFASDKVEWCRFEGPPAFVIAQDLPIELPDIGAAVADLVRIGHGCIACVKWPKQIKSIDPMNAGFFSRTGQQVQRIVKEKSEPCSDIPDQMGVSFYHEPSNPIALYRNVVIFGDGKVDRSPNGTATCAMMAAEEARGNIQIGQTIYSEGLLGSGMFEGCLVRETNVENNRALIGTVKGKSKITGYAKWAIDRGDPVGSGFIVQ